MILEEAIKNSDDFIHGRREVPYEELLKSIQLGVEALERIQWERKYKALNATELPSEALATSDNDS